MGRNKNGDRGRGTGDSLHHTPPNEPNHPYPAQLGDAHRKGIAVHSPGAEPAGKICGLARASELAGLARAAGRTVVVANGAFDLLHVGHVRYLAAARALGDLLVVAVNSDVSVRALKGPLRPIVPEGERAEILSHLDCVDVIVLFDEPTVTDVLRTLQPHIHAKGTDYTPETVPERAVVAAWGGRTVICGDPKDHATTDLLAEIMRRFSPATTHPGDSPPPDQGTGNRGQGTDPHPPGRNET